MASLLKNWEDVSSAPVDKVLPTVLASEVFDIRERLAAAPPDGAWRVALEVVDEERWPATAAGMVVAVLLKPGMAGFAADMLNSLVEVLSELEQCISVHYATLPRPARREVCLAGAPAQLQLQEGLLMTMWQLFTQAQQQRQRQGEQSSSSSCALGHGSDCPAVRATSDLTSAPAATGAGPPCRSCQLAHAELLAACSALLRYWPECVLDKGPVVSAWVGAAAECALHMLQDVSTAILQHQQPHADGTDSPQQQQQRAPPADVLQLGLAALDLLAAVCYAAACPSTIDITQLKEGQQLCERGALDLPCMLPSMLAVGAAAVLGQEMQRRLRKAAATSAGSGASSAAASSAAVAGCGADLAASPDATAPKDQSSQHGTAACALSSGNDSSKETGTAGMGPTANCSATDAAWELVCVTEQWAGGQLLPQPFTLLLEGLGCSPKAFLMLACVWQQQQPQGSSLQAAPQVEDVLGAHSNVFYQEGWYIFCGSSRPTASKPLLQRLSCCHTKGQHQPRHTQQHLLLALLLMRVAARGRARGMFQPATPPDAGSYSSDRLGECALETASAAARCVSTWLCWSQFKRKQQQEAQQEEPAAVGEAATAPSQRATASQPWDLGGDSSSAVLLEVVQGHCQLLQEGVRELQAVTTSWVATRSDNDSSSSSSDPDIEVNPQGEVSAVNSSVADILKDVLGLLRALLAAAAVDSGVLQQAAPHMFGLAGTLEQFVRLRCACHCDRLFLSIDSDVPQLLHLLLGSQDLSTFADFRHAANQQQQHMPRAAAAVHPACHSVQSCGLLPYLALAAPLGGQQQRQLLGLLFSSLKLFSAYPAGLYAFSWSRSLQGDWLVAACDTLWASCVVGRLVLVTGGPRGWDVVTRTPGCSQAAGGSTNGSTGKDQQHQDSTPQGGAGGQGSSCHSCGLGAEGTGALLPWVVLQGRALQLWVDLFRVYVQLPPAHAQGSKAGAKSSKAQDSSPQPCSLAGSFKTLVLLAGLFADAVAPSTQLLAVLLTGEVYGAEHLLAEPVQGWQLQHLPGKLLPPALRHSVFVQRMMYGVPEFVWPRAHSAHNAWLQQQLAKLGQQLRGHCREQGMDLGHLEAASGTAAAAVLQVLLTVMATGDSLKQLGDSAQEPHRLRQSDVRRYLKSWEVGDAAVLKGVLAMLSSGEHSAADVAVAAWLCSPSIAGDLLAQLQEFSSQLSTLPIHEACNNPACRVMVGSKEQGLVSGKACVCAGCRMGHYCSRACQREHWPLHQLQCVAVARRAGTTKAV